MVKTLGVISIAIALAIPLMVLDNKYSSGFLYKFFQDQAIEIVATVIALNVATVTFLLGHLVSIESKAQKPLFTKTKQEIKHNLYFMFGILAVMFILITSMKSGQAIYINSTPFYPIIFIATVLFILLFICLFEIIEVIFKITNFIIQK